MDTSIIQRMRAFFEHFCIPRYQAGEEQYHGQIESYDVHRAIQEALEEAADLMIYLVRARECAEELGRAELIPERSNNDQPAQTGAYVAICTNSTRPPIAIQGFIILDPTCTPVLERDGIWRFRGVQGQFLEFYSGQENVPGPGCTMSVPLRQR